MSLLDTPLLHVLGRALDLTAQRQELVTENLANIDTPKYHARDINFSQELERALGSEDEAPSTPMIREVSGSIERPDGNNVSIDRESLLMAQNQLQFQTEVAALRSEFNRLQSAINGGGSQ